MKTQQKSNVKYLSELLSKIAAGIIQLKNWPHLCNRGYTLIELTMVLIIVMILVVCAIPAFTNVRNTAKNTAAKSEIRVIEKAIIAFFTDRNVLPAQLSDVPGPEATLLDPWTHPYQYWNVESASGNAGGRYSSYQVDPNLNYDFDLFSMGIDGQSDRTIVDPTGPPSICSDDIVRVGDGGAVLLGSEY